MYNKVMILIISNIFSFAQHKNTKINEGIVTIKKKTIEFYTKCAPYQQTMEPQNNCLHQYFLTQLIGYVECHKCNKVWKMIEVK